MATATTDNSLGLSVASAALKLITQGFHPISLPPRSKGPVDDGWNAPERALDPLMDDLEALFPEGSNIGVLTGRLPYERGEGTSDLMDVDLDCPEAVALAPYLLPATDCTFGKGGEPRHWFYRVVGMPTSKFLAAGTMVVEVRGAGLQTMVPPSVHPSGAPIQWVRSGQPSQVEAAALRHAVSRLAAAALLARFFPEKGRHDYLLACAGWLAKHSEPDDLTRLLLAVANASGRWDRHRDKEIKALIEDTYEKNAAGANVAGLPRLLEYAPSLEPHIANLKKWLGVADSAVGAQTGSIDKRTGKPTIVINRRYDADEINEETFDLLAAINRQAPAIFQRGPELVRVRADAQRVLFIEPLAVDSLLGHLNRSMHWIEIKEITEKPTPQNPLPKSKLIEVCCRPPLHVVKNILSRPEWDRMPRLRVLTSIPVFSRTGTLVTEPGYHPDSELWYAPDTGLRLAPNPQPTPADVAAARDLLLEAICDFPFVDSQAGPAHFLAALLTPFVREMFRGCTPLFIFGAPGPGIGKGLLLELIGIILQGAPVSMGGFPPNEDEMRKQVISYLMAGASIITLDNIDRPLKSAALARALTSETYSDRELGVSEMKSLPNRALWLASGNNVSMLTDMARRTVTVRLKQTSERPWEREASQYRHPRLKEWATENRARLVGACLTLCQAWINAGKPMASHPPMGSFEGWSDTLAGILAHAGIGGFLAGYSDEAGAMDDDLDDWLALLGHWWEAHKAAPVYAKDLLPIVLKEGLLGVGSAQPDKQLATFSRTLRGIVDRVLGPFRVARVKDGSAGRRYCLERLESEGQPANITPDEEPPF